MINKSLVELSGSVLAPDINKRVDSVWYSSIESTVKDLPVLPDPPKANHVVSTPIGNNLAGISVPVVAYTGPTKLRMQKNSYKPDLSEPIAHTTPSPVQNPHEVKQLLNKIEEYD